MPIDQAGLFLTAIEISLDVDADRDGVVEKNNPRKVLSYQGTRPWTRELPGSRAPGWMLQAAMVLPTSTDSSPFTDKETEAHRGTKHLIATAAKRLPQPDPPSTGWDTQFAELLENVLPQRRHLLLLLCLFFF